ncbi:MAG: hypothetical protein V1494_07865 [Candidatus Diapherotrites archaeon]
MNKIIFALAFFFVIFLASAVCASSNWYLGISSHGATIEVFKGNAWLSFGTPYDYYYNDWYFFQQPWRYNYAGNWVNYDSGWYNFGADWFYSPYSYNYYSPSYYYHSGGWNYSPYWYSDPGITLYYNKYYPYYDPVIVPQSPYYYGGGVSYNPEKLAGCSEISLSAENAFINAGTTENVELKIQNNSTQDFKVSSIDAYIPSFDVEKSGLDYGSTVKAKTTAKVSLDLSASQASETQNFNAKFKVSGSFSDGLTYCSYSDIGVKEFNVQVNEASKAAKTQSAGTTFSASQPSAYAIVSPSTASTASNTWQSVEPDAPSNGIQQAEPQQETAFFQSNCNGLAIATEGISVESGGIAKKNFLLKNFGAEKFYIDSVEVNGSSGKFGVAPSYSPSFVFAGSESLIGVAVSAESVESDAVGSATVKVKGHYAGGVYCEAGPEEFYVFVEAVKKPACPNVSIKTPATVEAVGTAAAFSFTAENSADRQAIVSLSGKNLDVENNSFAIAPNTVAERAVLAENLSAEAGWVIFSISVPGSGCEYLQKTTKILGEKKAEAQGEGPGLVEGIELVSFTERADMNNSALIEVVLKNNSAENANVSLGIKGLPEGFYVRGIESVLPSGASRSFFIEVKTNNAQKGLSTGILEVVSGERVFERGVQFNVLGGISIEEPEEGTGETADQNTIIVPLQKIAASAFAVLSNNSLALGVLVLAILVIALLYVNAKETEKDMKNAEKWRGSNKE